MKKVCLILLMIIFSIIFFGGCAEDEDGVNITDSIQGSWSTERDFMSSYSMYEKTFRDDQLVEEVRVYMGWAEDRIYKTIYSFRIENRCITDEGDTCFELDYSYIGEKWIIYDGIDDFNRETKCGFDDWEVGKPKDITGTSCASALLNTEFFNIIGLDIHAYGIQKLERLRFGNKVTNKNDRPSSFTTRDFYRPQYIPTKYDTMN